MVPTPDPHAVAVMLLTLAALVLFTRDRIPLETSSLVVLVVLVLGFQLFPYTAADGRMLSPVGFFGGFAHEALVAVVALMVAGQGLVRTGALEPVGRMLARVWARAPSLSLLLTMVVAALLSAFINNTPIVVLLLPILISVALRSKIAPSSTLLPMGLATVIGGTATTIGTSTNLLVVAVAADLGLRRLEMFDFFVPAAIVGGVGILYLWLIAPRLIPERTPPLADTSPRLFSARLQIPEEGKADGLTLAELRAKASGLRVTQVRRGALSLVPLPDTVLRAGDQLIVSDTPERLKEFEQELGLELYAGDERVDDEHPLPRDEQQIAEIVVTPQTALVGVTLQQARFEERHQLRTLALHRTGPAPSMPLLETVLRVGDVLLVQGHHKAIRELKLSGELMVLDATVDLPHTSKAPFALAIMVAVIAAAATELVPIAVSAVCGVLLMLLSGCLKWRDATRAMSPAVILIVVASLALGTGLQATGATEYVAALFLSAASGLSAPVVLSGLILLLALLTNVVSNNAAAVIGTPFAVAIANGLGAPPEPFVLAVLFGANMSYATPMAYQTNLLVFSAGGYRFADFVRVGLPLSLLMWLGYSLLLPRLYGFG